MTSSGRTFLALCLSALLSLAAAPAAYAASYTDHMEDNNPDKIRTCYNLSPVAVSDTGSWGGLPDKTFLTFSQISESTGKIVYNVQGAEQITVGIYTHTGSFVHFSREKSLYMLGFEFGFETMNRRPSPSEQALYSPSRQIICTKAGGEVRKAVYGSSYEFPQPETPERQVLDSISDFIPYGVNVYTSPDGVRFTRVGLSPGAVDYRARTNYCYEEFTGTLPSGARQVMVELNDAPNYCDASTGADRPKTARIMAGLALVALGGEHLVMGPPQTEASGPDATNSQDSAGSGSSSESSQSSGSSKSSSGGSKKAPGSAEEEESVSSKKASSAKFEGSVVISPPDRSGTAAVSSSRTAQTASAKAQTASAKAAGEKTASDPPVEGVGSAPGGQRGGLETAQPAMAGDEVIVYTQAGKSPESRFTAAVTGYIVAVFGVIALVLLRSGRKK